MTTVSIKLELDVNLEQCDDLKKVAAEFDANTYMREALIPALKKAGVITDWNDGQAELTGVFK